MVNHHKLFCALLSYGIPRIIVKVLYNWYSKIAVAIRYHNVCLGDLLSIVDFGIALLYHALIIDL